MWCGNMEMHQSQLFSLKSEVLVIDPCPFILTLKPHFAHNSQRSVSPGVMSLFSHHHSQRSPSALSIAEEGKSSTCSCSCSYLRSPAASLCASATGQKGRATACHGCPSGTAMMTCFFWLSLAFPPPLPASTRIAWVPQVSCCLHGGPGGSQRYWQGDQGYPEVRSPVCRSLHYPAITESFFLYPKGKLRSKQKQSLSGVKTYSFFTCSHTVKIPSLEVGNCPDPKVANISLPSLCRVDFKPILFSRLHFKLCGRKHCCIPNSMILNGWWPSNYYL